MREFSLPAQYEVPAGSSLPDLLDRNATRWPDLAVIARHRADGGWTDVSASAFRDEVRAVAKGLLASGVRPGDRVGLMSHTRYEWALLDFAIWTAGAVTVPVYETSSPSQVAWILGDSGASAVVVETAVHRDTVASVRDELPRLSLVRALDVPNPDHGEGSAPVADAPTAPADPAATDAVGAVPELVRAGTDVPDEELDAARASLSPESPATVIYTSGTTGRPKGCVLTHRAFLSDAGNVVATLGPLLRTGDSSVLLFLPLAHVFARLVQVVAVMAPIRLGHTADVKNLTADLGSFRPTLVLGVPRVFEKVYNGARAKAHEDGRGRIFEVAADAAVAYSRALETTAGPGPVLRAKHALFDRLVYRRLRAVLGGRATHAISGGAALSGYLGHFYRGIGFTVLEGYGLTETCAPTAVNPPEAPRIGTVGRPLPGASVAIADDGEVLVRGDHLFTGYLNNEEATAAAVSDGWFGTGDLGSLDDEGYLTISGRKKEILVTAAGKNVSPGVIEDRIRSHALIAECMVVGDGRPFVAALITLDEDFLARWVDEHDKSGLSREQLLSDPDLRDVVQEAVDSGNALVSRAESVRKFRLLRGQFSQEAGHLTPSLKLKRHVVLREFAGEIAELYGR